MERTIREGEEVPAKKGRRAFWKNFSFDAEWKGKHYEIKQVMPVVVEEAKEIVVVTVYAFYPPSQKTAGFARGCPPCLAGRDLAKNL